MRPIFALVPRPPTASVLNISLTVALATIGLGCDTEVVAEGEVAPTVVIDSAAAAGELPFDRYLYEHARQGQFGGSILVALSDTVFEAAYRLPDAPAGAAPTVSSRFPLGELGQLLIRAAYFRLADQGRLDLNAAVGEALPALPQNDTINYRMLLDHRSGLPEVLPQGVALADVRLAGQPGTVERFSPLGYDLLARALAERLGTSAAEAVRVHVLEPAGMTDTGVLDPGAPPEQWAEGFRIDGGRLEALTYRDVVAPREATAVPEFYSTTTDLLYLAQWMPTTAYLDGRLQVVGARPGHRAFFHVEDDDDVVVALANLATPEWSRIARDLVAMAHGGQVALPRPVYRQEVPLPAGVEGFAGRYRLEGAGEYLIDFADDTLSITDPDGLRQRLRAETDTAFFTSPYARETVRLTPAGDPDSAGRVSVVTAAGREVVLERVGQDERGASRE